MTIHLSDKTIRGKLRNSNKAIREEGLEALDATYRDPVFKYLSAKYKAAGCIHLLNEIPDIWIATVWVVWRKAGPHGAIRANGNLWNYLLTIIQFIAKNELRRIARLHSRLDGSSDIADLETPGAVGYDEPHDLQEVLKGHTKNFTMSEVWILEIDTGLHLPHGEVAVEEKWDRNRRMEAISYWYNMRVDDYNQSIDVPMGQSEGSENNVDNLQHIDAGQAGVILRQARRRLRRIGKSKEKSNG